MVKIIWKRALRHPNVLLFMGYAKTPETIMLVTGSIPKPVVNLCLAEYMPGGSLTDLLLNKSQFLSLEMMVSLAHDIALGLNFLHTNNPPILHRDLKSHNLLVKLIWNI